MASASGTGGGDDRSAKAAAAAADRERQLEFVVDDWRRRNQGAEPSAEDRQTLERTLDAMATMHSAQHNGALPHDSTVREWFGIAPTGQGRGVSAERAAFSKIVVVVGTRVRVEGELGVVIKCSDEDDDVAVRRDKDGSETFVKRIELRYENMAAKIAAQRHRAYMRRRRRRDKWEMRRASNKRIEWQHEDQEGKGYMLALVLTVGSLAIGFIPLVVHFNW